MKNKIVQQNPNFETDPQIERIRRALLYEGYALFPYRKNALKNRKRFNFGVLAPRDWALKQPNEDFFQQIEILVAAEGKTEILIFSPDFAAEFGGAAILQQKLNAMFSSERRRLFLVLIEDNGATLNAHEAFIRNLNLIVNTADIEKLPLVMNRALRDFNELYHYFNQAAGMASI